MIKMGVIVICYMAGFINLPPSVRGPVTFTLKNHITVAVYNRNKTELVEMTFAKNKCRRVSELEQLVYDIQTGNAEIKKTAPLFYDPCMTEHAPDYCPLEKAKNK